MPRKTQSARVLPADDEVLTPDELATMLKVDRSTVYVWRNRGMGPEGFKVCGALRYRRSEVVRWLTESGDTAMIGLR